MSIHARPEPHAPRPRRLVATSPGRRIALPPVLASSLALAALLGLGGCATAPAMQAGLQPFSSDGCSLFPNRAPAGQADWCGCCLAHDLAYWRGGKAEERLKADQDLAHCVQAAAGNPALAATMLAGVRAGGGPYFLTPYRWGYGWPYGRMYQPLSQREAAQADSLRAAYLASNPTLACTPGAGPIPTP